MRVQIQTHKGLVFTTEIPPCRVYNLTYHKENHFAVGIVDTCASINFVFVLPEANFLKAV